MENSFKIVQQRGTLFFPQTIGYTPENATRFKQLFLPTAVEMAMPQIGIPPQGTNMVLPQYGMPWQLVSQSPNNTYKVLFSPNKLDIIFEAEGELGKIDDDFVSFCSDKFQTFINETKYPINRIAYAPLFSLLVNDENPASDFWKGVLKRVSHGGVPFQNIEFNYLIKRIEHINGKDIEMNFLHQLTDGYHMTEGKKDADCILCTIDMNTIPEMPYSFELDDVKAFYRMSIEWNDEVIHNLPL